MSTQPPAVLLLGGLAVAWNQRYLRAAAVRGLRVLVVDAPTAHLSDLLAEWRAGDHAATVPAEVASIPATEVTAIVDQAATWSRTYALRGVCTLREDYVEAAAIVADLLDLPTPGLRAARVCRNKHLQRRYLARWSPRSEPVGPDQRDAAADAWSTYPAIVKPVGRLASSGVQMVADAAGLRAALADYPAGEFLLVEERAIGHEYSIESLSWQGELRYLEITRKRTTEHDSAYFVEMGHTTPPPDLSPDDRQRLREAHVEILARLDFGTGMAHAEYRQVSGAPPTLIEIAARPPGDSIMALHWLATGAALEDDVIALCVGEDIATHPGAHRFARQVYLPHQPGVLDRLAVEAGLGVGASVFDPARIRAQVDECGAGDDPPAVRCVIALKEPGTVLGPLRESADRAAMFVVDAATPDELDAIEGRCRDAITLRMAA